MKAYVPGTVMQIFLALVLSVSALSVLAGRCDNPKWAGSDECEPPVMDPVILEVDVYFGDDGAGDPSNCTNT